MQPSESTGIISQQAFEEYTLAWEGFIESANSEVLTNLFKGPSDTSLPFVSLPYQQLVWLLSTLGMQQIKARFVLLPAASAEQARFSIALFATGENNAPVSAYYLADAAWQPTQPPLQETEVPLALAATWLNNWTAAAVVEPAMFASGSAPLQGYNFAVRDFLDPLFALKTVGSSQSLRVYFGLHDYYRATEAADGPAFAQTFGLVLRLAGAGISNAASYDMALPSPPAP